MEELQAIDLILNVVIKVGFILILTLIGIVLFQLKNSIIHIKKIVETTANNVESTAKNIQNEFNIEKIGAKLKKTTESIVKIYLINGIRKEIFSFGKRLFK